MTQLFDTETYEDAEEAEPTQGFRHLRSVASHHVAGGQDSGPVAVPIKWRLDDQTIETGRRGIQAAREALQLAAKENQSPVRKAA